MKLPFSSHLAVEPYLMPANFIEANRQSQRRHVLLAKP